MSIKKLKIYNFIKVLFADDKKILAFLKKMWYHYLANVKERSDNDERRTSS